VSRRRAGRLTTLHEKEVVGHEANARLKWGPPLFDPQCPEPFIFSSPPRWPARLHSPRTSPSRSISSLAGSGSQRRHHRRPDPAPPLCCTPRTGPVPLVSIHPDKIKRRASLEDSGTTWTSPSPSAAPAISSAERGKLQRTRRSADCTAAALTGDVKSAAGMGQ